MTLHFINRLRYIRKNILGINLRNSEFIFKHNPKNLYPLVDDKILTKEALQKALIPSPEMHFAIRSYFDLRALEENISVLKSFVIKPSNGFGGEGVLIVEENQDGHFRLASDEILSVGKVRCHVQEILAGVYSLNQMPDSALCEYKIRGRTDLMKLSYKGIPDIRVLVFRGIPVMAMLRLSTKTSKGKANLHQGGIGVGIDLTTGMTTHAFSQGGYVTSHPDNQADLIGFSIPQWDDLLAIAVKCYQAVPLGYLGVDLVLDEHLGPLVLELNARPGLQLQMANRIGLRQVLTRLQSDDLQNFSLPQKIALGKTLYQESRQLAEEAARL